MKTQNCIQRIGKKLRTLARASAVGAAVILATGPAARADLIGHWLSGASSLEETSGLRPATTHAAVAVGPNAGALAFTADVPPGYTGQSLDLTAGNVGVMVANSATTDAGYLDTFDAGISDQMTVTFWAKGFPDVWSPWVSKRGDGGSGWQVRRFSTGNNACFTLRGVENEDGGGSTVSVNDTPARWRHFAVVWNKGDGTRALYVDGALSHMNYNNSSQGVILAPDKHLAFGTRQGAGAGFESYFQGRLFDIRVYNQALFQEEVADLILPAMPQNLVATPANGKVALEWTHSFTATSYTVATTNSVTSAVQTNEVFPWELPYTKTGLTNNVLYRFKVRANNGSGSSAYTVEASATPALGTAKDILTFSFGDLGPATISGNTVIKDVPLGTDLTFLSPTYTVSPFSLEDANFPAGTTRDFTTPQTYTITAENGSTKVYTVTVNQTAPITYDFSSGLQGWTQIWPAAGNGFLWQDGVLSSGGDNDETRFGRSPDFYLNNVGDLTFQLRGGESQLAAPDVAPSLIPANSIVGKFAGVALRDVATDTYVLSKRRTGDGDNFQSLGLTAAELAPFVHNNRKYTLDYIDYNKGSWGWTWLDNISIPGTLPPAADMTSLTFIGPAAFSGNNVTLTLPFGTSVTALAPTYTLSPGATCNKPSGSTQNFSSPVNYTVVSSDTLLTRVYTVTAVVLPAPDTALVGHWVSGAESLADSSGYTSPGTHDGVALGGNAGALAFNPNDLPLSFGGSSLDLRAGNVGVMINNSANSDAGYQNTFDGQINNQLTVSFWAKGFPATWAPWVSKGGEDNVGWQFRRFSVGSRACFTVRGLDDADGSGSTVDVNDSPARWHHFAGVWDQSTGIRSLYVDGVLSHDNSNTLGQVIALATQKHLALGARQTGANGENFDSFFAGLLFDVRVYKQKLFAAQIQTVMTTPTPAQPAEAKIRTFGLPGQPAEITGTNIVWTLPLGTNLSVLAPTFTLTAGATCNPVSGTVRNFSTPQTYTVTASNSTVNVYTVSTMLGNTFATSNTLDGWHNRVWDATAAAWVDLAADIWTMPATINGGVIQPPGLYSLFRTGEGSVLTTDDNGGRDNHLNTLWLRSPQFKPGGSGDLTVQLAKGFAHAIAPASEAAVPFAATTDSGWVGVILRRVSDGAFVLTKTKTQGANDIWYTMTFTQAELAPYVGVACTLELINMNRGNWGWVAMDNVVLPAGSSTPSVVTDPFAAWIAANYPGLSDKTPAGDPDRDGMSNQAEFAFGLNPGSGNSVNPIIVQLNKTSGTFQYTRLDPAVSGLVYTVQTSQNLSAWTRDASATATQSVTATNGSVQTVTVTLTGAPLGAPKLFVQVKAN